ncbi:metallophosphoesterase [Ectobacillus panaciterrae]|uniref:metallophosphoesterase n=1 Tax=Ectobacillus panaciterrae TaxID=363872 RepID=UPI0003FBDD1D|nr:metallophosphoesterase [Ectobacillus panaciterrae]
MIFLFFISIFLVYFIYRANQNTRKVIVNTVSPVAADVTAPNCSNLRVLQLSDMHLENLSISPEKLYNELKRENFDLIALTGDYLDRPKSIPKLIPYLELFQKLNPKYGIYAVFGNHDYILREDSFRRLKEMLEQYGIKTMQNQNDTIIVEGNLVHIIGIDDYHTKRSSLNLAYDGVTENSYRLVLTHDPNLVLQMEKFHFNYLLAGHFHGGQIYWPKPYHLRKFGKLVRLNLIKGLIHYQGKVFYINEGLGQTLFNIRVGSRPEITIHELMIHNCSTSTEEQLDRAI